MEWEDVERVTLTQIAKAPSPLLKKQVHILHFSSVSALSDFQHSFLL